MSLRVAVVVAALCLAVPVAAQNRPEHTLRLAQQQQQQQRTGDKRLLVAENMWLTEAEAKAFWPIYDRYQIDIDEAEVALARTYAAKLDAALPGKKVARYLQLERKIRANLRYELADKIPLVK
jgi:hypothetical protein